MHPPEGIPDITSLLSSAWQGATGAGEALVDAVYQELRQMAAAKVAQERPEQALDGTELVHEAWLRLGNGHFENRAHFFGAAAEAMRRVLVERARRAHREKRGGGAAMVTLDEAVEASPGDGEEILAVHEALDRLAERDPRKAELVKLRYFAGLSFEECAALLGVSVATAKRDWAYFRAWLHQMIHQV